LETGILAAATAADLGVGIGRLSISARVR
jgi:hypothetical protein